MHGFFKLSVVFSLLVVLFLLAPYVGVDVSYYESRLQFDESTSNLTALVYMQGWDDAYNALLKTNWFGLGFQNMGSLEPGVYGEKIFKIVGVYKNRLDGGFLAAKIVGEFGVIGLLFVLFYMISLLMSILYCRKFFKAYQADREEALEIFSVSTVLGCSFIIVFLIEMFARGYGYFSPGMLLVMVSVFLIVKKEKNCLKVK